jgi:hypothetical protein
MAGSLGKYYDQVKAGRCFVGNTAAAGVASPISTGTAVTFGLWNTSSTKNAVPLWINIGYTSGTIALGVFGLANQYCGFTLATAAPLSAFTDGTPKNLLLGSGQGSSMRFTPSGATLTAGGTSLMSFDAGKASATAALGEINGLGYEFDGSVIVTPGQLIFVASSIAQTGVYTMSMAWAEIDI